MCSVLAMTEETKQLGFIDALATLNSFLRTVIALVLLAVILAVGWLAYDKLDATRQLTKAQDELKLVSLQLTEKEGEVKKGTVLFLKDNQKINFNAGNEDLLLFQAFY